MTETYVSYEPGGWTLLARDGRYLLVEAPPASEPVRRLWAALDGTPSEALLAFLGTDLPGSGFCFLEVAGGSVLLAQDKIGAALDGRPVGAGRSLAPLAVPAGGGMIIAATEAGSRGLQFPLESGVVSAGALVVVQVPSDDALLPGLPGPDADPVPEAVTEPDSTQLWADVPEFDDTALEDPVVDQEPADPEPVAEPDASLDGPAPSLSLADAPPPQVVDPADEPEPDPAAYAGQTVLAGFCLQGHLSPAHGALCRVCGTPMPAQTPRTIPRPTLGALVLASGETFDLDRNAVLGRAPRVPDDASEEPHLVNLAAFGRDVSRQHAEVIVHGWNVFVRDLGSANGTRVHDASGGVTTLDPEVPVLLEPGGRIEVAEITTIEFRTEG